MLPQQRVPEVGTGEKHKCASKLSSLGSAKALRYAPGATYKIEGRKSDGGDDSRGGKHPRH